MMSGASGSFLFIQVFLDYLVFLDFLDYLDLLDNIDLLDYLDFLVFLAEIDCYFFFISSISAFSLLISSCCL